MMHSCSADPEGCTDACDFAAQLAYERSPEGRRRLAIVRRIDRLHPTATLAERLRMYDEAESA